jgi:DNA-binding transcriptional ArsR family regulator
MASLDGKKLKQIIDPTLAKAFTHPLRGHIWVVTFERGEVSPTEIAKELGLKASDVNYHFRELKRRELIKVVRVVQRRGFEEHFYQPVISALDFDDAEWMKLPAGVRASLSGEMLRQIIESFVQALGAGSFDARDRHLSRSWLLVDERGWREAMGVARLALQQFQAIQERSAKRNQGSSVPRIPVSIVLAAFETAAAVPAREAGRTESL